MSDEMTPTSGSNPARPPLYVVLGHVADATRFTRERSLDRRDVIPEAVALRALRGVDRPVVLVRCADDSRVPEGGWNSRFDVIEQATLINGTRGYENRIETFR